jgi:hypothetical protein
LIFFDDEGTEAGGLTYGTRDDGSGRDNYGSWTVDQYDQNEQLALTYAKVKGHRAAGLTVYADHPETSLLPVIQAYAEFQAAKTPADKQRAQARLKELAPNGVGGVYTRAFVGKDDEEAKLVLGDKAGHPRLVLAVDADGAPRIEMLDASGKVIKRITDK